MALFYKGPNLSVRPGSKCRNTGRVQWINVYCRDLPREYYDTGYGWIPSRYIAKLSKWLWHVRFIVTFFDKNTYLRWLLYRPTYQWLKTRRWRSGSMRSPCKRKVGCLNPSRDRFKGQNLQPFTRNGDVSISVKHSRVEWKTALKQCYYMLWCSRKKTLIDMFSAIDVVTYYMYVCGVTLRNTGDSLWFENGDIHLIYVSWNKVSSGNPKFFSSVHISVNIVVV